MLLSSFRNILNVDMTDFAACYTGFRPVHGGRHDTDCGHDSQTRHHWCKWRSSVHNVSQPSITFCGRRVMIKKRVMAFGWIGQYGYKYNYISI